HYFEQDTRPIREAIEFYKHKQNWSNRLIAGDSLIVMNSLLEKEGMSEKVQMIYIDPPYGIKYGSNFQPFVNKRDVKDGKDEDLTQEPEMIKAFRDTWELGIHSYLTYLRDRLKLAKKLLHESGSCFVQISDENVHHVREIMDEVFGPENYISQITLKRASVMFDKKYLNNACFYTIWYAKDAKQLKYRDLFTHRDIESFAENSGSHLWVENDKVCRKVSSDEREDITNFLTTNTSFRLFGTLSINAQGTEKREAFSFNGKKYYPPEGTQWKTSYSGLEVLKKKNRLVVEGNTIRYKQYIEDYPVVPINSLWSGIGAASDKIYVVQTSTEIVRRCLLMTTDPGDLVLDPTCGSGTTAYVAEQWGRRWITCDTSRVSITLAKQRIMTALFNYYELAHQSEGVSSGFKYKTVPHITLGSIANNEPAQEETLYDQPLIDRKRKRVTGPFTLEAVPSQRVTSFADVERTIQEPDITIARSGETIKQNDWIDEMLATGIRGKAGQKIEFTRIETIGGTRYIQAEAETKDGQKAVISFGPQYAPLEQRQVELVVGEAQTLVPKPKIIIFASFQFDPEAAKDIDELKWPGVNILKVQMNTDLLTNDLKKKRSSSESFWLMGQPDIEIRKKDGKYIVQVNGFDYYDTKTGQIISGDTSKIAMWELDTDYDGRSLYPRQVFFPMAGKGEGWDKLAKNVRAVIDEELIEQYKGNVSIPFKLGNNKRVAVKIIDDRGIESLKIIEVKE
ncbi:MAG: site-specific DNA-methyltransferase, partial [Candidatus Woesearchaeota archaeon]|nr:site-specific DNA-methyltransferase [Candidatus Woesearchaeota archaeon]